MKLYLSLTFLFFFTSIANANDRLIGTWYNIPDEGPSSAKYSEYIISFKKDGEFVEIFNDLQGQFDVFGGHSYSTNDDKLTLTFADGDSLEEKISFKDDDTLVREYDGYLVEYRRMDNQGLLGAAFSLAQSGKVKSIRQESGAGYYHFNATSSAQIYLYESQGSIVLFHFDDSDLSGEVSSQGGKWFVPVSSSVAALAVGDLSFIPEFDELISEHLNHYSYQPQQ